MLTTSRTHVMHSCRRSLNLTDLYPILTALRSRQVIAEHYCTHHGNMHQVGLTSDLLEEAVLGI